MYGVEREEAGRWNIEQRRIVGYIPWLWKGWCSRHAVRYTSEPRHDTTPGLFVPVHGDAAPYQRRRTMLSLH